MSSGLRAFYLISAVTALAQGALTVGLPLAAYGAGVPPAGIGLIGGARFAVAALVAFPVGIAADALGRRRMLILSLVVLVLACAGLTMTRSVAGLFALAAFAGMANGGFLPAINALAADATPEGAHGQVFGWLTLSFHLGMSVGPALGGAVIEVAGTPATFALAAVLALAALALASRVRVVEHALFGLRGLHAGVAASVRGMRGQAAVVAAWIASMAISLGWGANIALFPAFAAGLGIGAAVIGLIFGAQSLANATSRLPLGRLVDGMAHPARWAGPAIVGYAALLAVLPHLRAPLAFAAVLALGVMPVALVYIYAQAVIARRLTLASRGLGMGGYTAFVFVGNAGGPILGGAIAGDAGYAWGFGAVAALMAGIGLFHRWLARWVERA